MKKVTVGGARRGEKKKYKAERGEELFKKISSQQFDCFWQ